MQNTSGEYHLFWIGLEVTGGMLVTLFPEFRWIGYIVLALGVLMMLYAVISWVTKFGWSFVGFWHGRIFLRDAVAKAYKKIQNTGLARRWERMAQQHGMEIEAIIADMLIKDTGDPPINVYGISPPSKAKMRIPKDDIRSSMFISNANDLEPVGHNGPSYKNLEIDVSGFKVRLKALMKLAREGNGKG